MDFLGVAVESWSFRVNLCWTVWIKTSHVQAKCWRSDYTGGNLIVIIVWPILRKKSLPKTWVNFRKSWPFLFLVCFPLSIWCFSDFYSRFHSTFTRNYWKKIHIEEMNYMLWHWTDDIYETILVYLRAIFEWPWNFVAWTRTKQQTNSK